MTCECSLVGTAETVGEEDLFRDWLKRYRRSRFFLWSRTQKHSAGVTFFFSFSNDHQDLFHRVFSRTRCVRSFGVVYYPLLPSLFPLCLLVSAPRPSPFLSRFCSFFQTSINHRDFYHRFYEKNNHQRPPLSFVLRNLAHRQGERLWSNESIVL